MRVLILILRDEFFEAFGCYEVGAVGFERFN